jgi:hypothetical protein
MNVTRLRASTGNRAVALLTKWLRLEAETMIAKLQGRLAHPQVQEETEIDVIELIKGCTITILIKTADGVTTRHNYSHNAFHRSGDDHDTD